MNKSKQTPHEWTGSDIPPVKFWGTIAIGALGLLVNIVLLRTAFQLPATTISYLARALHASIIVAGSLMILLTLRGHQKLGAQIAFYTIVVLFVSGSFIYAESVLTASFSFVTIATIIISQLLSKEVRRRSIVVTGLGLMITWIAAWMNPSWRLPPTPVGVAGIVVAILFALILAVIVFRQAQNVIASSIRNQITVWTGLLVAILSIVLTTYSIITNRQTIIHSAEAEALAIAEARAADVKNQLDPALDAARTMAYSLAGNKDAVHPISLTRHQANGILRKVAEENPAFLGTWTIWEPNAFDGQDAQYANTPLHDSTGRFIPYWVRVNDSVHGEAVRDYEKPGAGDFYVVPRQTKKETLISPYYYEIGGKQVLLTTVSIPIMENDRFYGVAGVDIKIDFVQSIVDGINLYDGTATAVLVTDTGTMVAVRNQPGQTLQPATSLYPDFEQLRPQIAADKSFISVSPDGKYLRVFSPVILGKTASHSSLSLIIPFSAITAPATTSALREVVIGVSIIIFSLLILWYLMGLITRPIIDLTAVANTISAGNLNAVADVKATNEIGTLAKAFNAMTSQLRNTFDTLEQRVADRAKALTTSSEVSRRLAFVRSTHQLAKEVVEQVQLAFHYYHAHIYFVDAESKDLVMAGGTGEAGETMLARGHKIPNGRGLVGRAASTNTAILVPDVTKEEGWLPNPLLPETRSEAAVPIGIGNQVLGVLDVQQNVANGLAADDISLLQSLAGQIAISLQTARTFEETTAKAEREALINTIGQKIQRAPTVEDTLKIAIRELSLAVGAQSVSARIRVKTQKEE